MVVPERGGRRSRPNRSAAAITTAAFPVVCGSPCLRDGAGIAALPPHVSPRRRQRRRATRTERRTVFHVALMAVTTTSCLLASFKLGGIIAVPLAAAGTTMSTTTPPTLEGLLRDLHDAAGAEADVTVPPFEGTASNGGVPSIGDPYVIFVTLHGIPAGSELWEHAVLEAVPGGSVFLSSVADAGTFFAPVTALGSNATEVDAAAPARFRYEVPVGPTDGVGGDTLGLLVTHRLYPILPVELTSIELELRNRTTGEVLGVLHDSKRTVVPGSMLRNDVGVLGLGEAGRTSAEVFAAFRAFDGDGAADLVVVHANGTSLVHQRSAGNNVFSSQEEARERAVALGFGLHKDGHGPIADDFVCGASFEAEAVGVAVVAAAVEDLTGDGFLDAVFVVECSASSSTAMRRIVILHHNGTSLNIVQAVTCPAPCGGLVQGAALQDSGDAATQLARAPLSIVIADISGDGAPDLLVASHLFLNVGDGTLPNIPYYDVGCERPVVAMLTDDTLLDVACADVGQLRHFEWIGEHPTIVTRPLGVSGSSGALALDVDRDSDLDLVLYHFNHSAPATPREAIRFALNDGEGQFEVSAAFVVTFPAVYPAERPAIPIVVSQLACPGDFDHDGDQDILLFGDDRRVLLAMDSTYASWGQPNRGVLAGAQFRDVAADRGISIAAYRNVSDGTPSGNVDSESASVVSTTACAVGDADGDGDDDVYLAQGTAPSALFANTMAMPKTSMTVRVFSDRGIASCFTGAALLSETPTFALVPGRSVGGVLGGAAAGCTASIPTSVPVVAESFRQPVRYDFTIKLASRAGVVLKGTSHSNLTGAPDNSHLSYSTAALVPFDVEVHNALVAPELSMLPWDGPRTAGDVVDMTVSPRTGESRLGLGPAGAVVQGRDVSGSFAEIPGAVPATYRLRYTIPAGEEDWPAHGLRVRVQLQRRVAGADTQQSLPSPVTDTVIVAGTVWREVFGDETGFDNSNPQSTGQHVENVYNVRAVDIDNDGDTDIVASGLTQSSSLPDAFYPLSLYRNTGTGTAPWYVHENPALPEAIAATVRSSTSPHLWHCQMTVCDLDGDGWMDIATVQKASSSQPLYVVWNAGDGSLLPVDIVAVLPDAAGEDAGMSCADVNGDGYADLLVSRNEPGTDRSPMLMYKGGPSRTLTLLPEDAIDMMTAKVHLGERQQTRSAYRVARVDLDEDGRIDVLHMGGGANTFYYSNTHGDGVSWLEARGSGAWGLPYCDFDAGEKGDAIVRAVRGLLS